MVDMRNAHKISAGKPEGKTHLEDTDVSGRILIKWTSKVVDGGCGWCPVVVSCGDSNDPSDFNTTGLFVFHGIGYIIRYT
jgi:hypothetical protein